MFTQNALVEDYNEKVYDLFSGDKYEIKAQDSVIGACSAELKEKIVRKIPYVPLKNSKQLARKLKPAVGQRTEMAINVRTDDGLTNGASNIIKFIQLRDECPSTFSTSTVKISVFPSSVFPHDGKTEIFTVEVLKVLGH